MSTTRTSGGHSAGIEPRVLLDEKNHQSKNSALNLADSSFGTESFTKAERLLGAAAVQDSRW